MAHRKTARKTIKEINKKAGSEFRKNRLTARSGDRLFKNFSQGMGKPFSPGGFVTLKEHRQKQKAEKTLRIGGKQRNPSATRRKRRPRSIRGRR